MIWSEALFHRVQSGMMSESKRLKPLAFNFHAGIHRVHITHLCGRPQALCDGGGSWPEARIDISRAYHLRPHTRFSAEDHFLLLGRQLCRVPAKGIIEVMLFCRFSQIEVITVGQQGTIALLNGFCL